MIKHLDKKLERVFNGKQDPETDRLILKLKLRTKAACKAAQIEIGSDPCNGNSCMMQQVELDNLSFPFSSFRLQILISVFRVGHDSYYYFN